MNPVFVYRHKETGNIRCEYFGGARFMEDELDWEHIDTLEPKQWIEINYKKVMQ